jgi:hypothetical protein
MVYPAKVTEIKRLSPHAEVAVKPVRMPSTSAGA